MNSSERVPLSGEQTGRVVERPKTQYALAVDGINVAYQVFGQESPDLVVVPGWVSHLEVIWEDEQAASFFRRLGEFSRVILFDKRGTGMSDPVTHSPPVDERMDDIGAVMEATNSERAAFLGYSEGGPLALAYAATHPDRTSGVIAYGSYARVMQAPDYPIGWTDETVKRLFDGIRESARTGEFYDVVTPSRRGDEEFREWFSRFTRQAASPAMMELYFRANMGMDVRPLLTSLRFPVLVLHRVGDSLVNVEHGRYLAEHTPGAKYVELEGGDHWPWFGDSDAIVEEVEEFLTGMRHVGSANRVLTNVMFTDIAHSTEQLARLGDKAWGEKLNQHDAAIRRQVERFRGRAVKNTGDGFLAIFDGPARAVQCARAIQGAARSVGLEVRAGLHVGECEVRHDDVRGLAVHIAARVAEVANDDEVLVSRTVKDLIVGSGIDFEDRGEHELKGVPGTWNLFAVKG
jgi:pimeloyl-ACP methyl ester carboxylesterase/class 3 adenylate cyclase